MQLLGSTQFTLDDAGRLTIPAKMREYFEDKSAEKPAEKSLVVSLSKDKSYLTLYPQATWNVVVERLKGLAQTRILADRVRLRLGKNSEKCKIDSAWRVLIPEKWRRELGIQKEVALVGGVEKLTVWNPEVWAVVEKQLDEDPQLDALEEQYLI